MKTLLLLPALPAAFLLGLRAAAPTSPAPAQIPPAVQDPETDEDLDEFPPGWRGEQLRRKAQLTEDLLGHWQLIEFRHSTNNLEGTAVAGFMTIDPEVLTILIHASIQRPNPLEEPLQLQGGAHYWRLDEQLRLQTASILSHSNFSGVPVFEPGLTPREYEPTILQETELTLRRSDGSLLIFRRVPGLTFPDAAIGIIDALRAGQDPSTR